MYDRDPGGLLVVLVIHHCVNTMEAMMLTACSNEEDEHEVNASVGCKAEGRSTAVYRCHLVGWLVAVDSLSYTPAHANVDGYFCQGRRCQHGTA